MNVSELIEQLRQVPPATRVLTWVDGELAEIQEVKAFEVRRDFEGAWYKTSVVHRRGPTPDDVERAVIL